MISLDIKGSLAQTISPSRGITDPELSGMKGSVKHAVDTWLEERKSGAHAWSADPYAANIIAQVKDAAARIKSQRIQTVVWIGIGGSGLGPRVIQEAFETPDTLEFLVMDTIDPAQLSLQLSLLDIRRTFVIIASKSGGTLEPMSIFFLMWEKLQEAHKEKAHEYALAVTDPAKGNLKAFCDTHNIPTLPIPSDVGGRYSIFTPIGLLPLVLLNGDIDRFVHGAKVMDTACQNPNMNDNPAALLAAMQFLLDTKRDCPLRVIMSYSQRLRSLAGWNQQLIAESLGKTETYNPIPIAALGTQDQHSLLQQWIEGPRKSWHLFIQEEGHPSLSTAQGVDDSFAYTKGKDFGQLLDACYKGTSGALTEVKRPHCTLSLPHLSEEYLGQLFFLLLAEVVFLGSLYRIDPYGQPGVEIGKKITKSILESMD
jgi:glucose-6-phosphate isomerase